MTDKEINRATINAFLARAINRAAVTAVDAEFGLRVLDATVIEPAGVRIQFVGGQIAYVDFTHLVPRTPTAPTKGAAPDARA